MLSNNGAKKAIVLISVLACAGPLLLWIAVEWHSNSSSTPETRSKPAITSEIAVSINSQQIPSTLQYYVSRIFSRPPVDVDSEKFTIVMMTYKRTNILLRVLGHYCKTPRLQGIVVIWNNIQQPVPENLRNLSCEVPLKLIQETENRLTNRFKPRPEIETECIVIIDDDKLFTEQNDITYGFTVWQQFRHRIVGFQHRSHTLSGGKYHYDYTNKLGYSLMIGATQILHKAYLEMFNDPKVLPRAMFEYIDKSMECDDIGICVMVAQFLEDVAWPQCAVLSVAHSKLLLLEEEASEGFRGLHRRPNHLEGRSNCLNKLTEFYGSPLPLHYTLEIVKRTHD